MVRTQSDAANTECPICMDPVKFGVETNCGHLYCGNCILQVWQGTSGLSPMVCPYCRQEVTLLLSCFTENESDAADLLDIEERERLVRKISEYNRLFSQHPRSLWGQIRDLPTILRHVCAELWAELFTWRGLEMLYRVRVMLCFAVAFIYAITPFDLFPEAVLGLFGLLDDIIIVVFLLIQVSVIYRNHIGARD